MANYVNHLKLSIIEVDCLRSQLDSEGQNQTRAVGVWQDE